MYIQIYQPSFFMRGKYERVFAGNVDCENRDEIAQIFCKGTEDPRAAAYRGAGLQSNNLVEVHEGGEKKLYHVEACDWDDGRLTPCSEEIDFTAAPNVQNTVMGVLLERGKLGAVKRLSIRDIVKQIGGGDSMDIEAISMSDNICCVTCERGLNHSYEDTVEDLNRTILHHVDNEVMGICCGPAFFCGMRMMGDDEHMMFCDLSQYDAGQILNKYRLPERFFNLNGKIRSVPYYPNISIIKE